MKTVVEGCLQDARPTETGFTATFVFPTGLEVFEGHFPNVALVPGVFLVEAVRCAAERVLKRACSIRRVSDAKFTAEVAPDDPVTVEAALDGERCNAVVTTPKAEAARIKLVLGRQE